VIGARIHAWTGPKAVELDVLPDPVPRNGEVLLEVERCGINRSAVTLCYGQYGGLPRTSAPFSSGGMTLPHALGAEASGMVAEVGPGENRALIGGRVTLIPRFGCQSCPRCHSGEENLCEHVVTLGTSTPDRGALDQFVAVPARNIVLLPAEMSFDDGASITTEYAPAWWIVHDLAGMREGSKVLVKGASGNVGLAVLDIARMVGAETWAVTRDDSKVNALKGAGAEHVVVGDPSALAGMMQELTSGGPDIVVEPFGGGSFRDSIRCVRRGGVVAVVGAFVGALAEIDLRIVFHHGLRIVGGPHSPSDVIDTIVSLVAKRLLVPQRGQIFAHSEVIAALEAQEKSEIVGKVLVAVSS
jgi:NADPH:quinone reductase-like Zn-dependent oxidoreductase